MLRLFRFNGWRKPGQKGPSYTLGKVYTVDIDHRVGYSGDRLGVVLADDKGEPRVFFAEDFTYVGPATTEEGGDASS